MHKRKPSPLSWILSVSEHIFRIFSVVPLLAAAALVSTSLTCMCSYLFTHSALNRRIRNPMNEYWKGLVTEIKTLTSRPDALVKVRWFWGKKDITSAIEDIEHTVDPKLKRWAFSLLYCHLKLIHPIEYWLQQVETNFFQERKLSSTPPTQLNVSPTLS